MAIFSKLLRGLIPRMQLAEQERQRQEQRRLFYVGITRSTETLVINNSIRMPYAAAFQMRMPVLARAGAYAILQASPMLPELDRTAPPAIPAAAWRAQLGF
jgi:DNA helicase II / ATP-dependent DNA helicase PcrA